MSLLEALTFAFCFLIVLLLLYRREYHNYKSIIPTNWPFLGTLPTIFLNVHRLHDYATDILACSGGTFLFKGCWIAKMDVLCTSSPADIHYILSKNFPNYPKGIKFRKIFKILGDGFSNSDGDMWEFHRRTLKILLSHPGLQIRFDKTVWGKVEHGLLPVLDNVSRLGVETDLQDIFQRFAFDVICELLMDYDPKSMSLGFPDVPCEKALSHVEEAILSRYITPPKFIKWQQSLRIGNEKKLRDAWKIIDQFIYKLLEQKQKDHTNINSKSEHEKFSFLMALTREFKNQSVTSKDPNKLLRDTLLNLMIAGSNTTSSSLSWLFYLLAKNPMAEDKIRKELRLYGGLRNGIQEIDLCKLEYLHGGICEALRLFPPVPFQQKNPIQPDTLPSGHQVDPNTPIILCFYTMGRMESIWGKDCMEFKPERWFAPAGGIKHQPSYNFPAFNAGPRTCLGKNMSFTQMKIVAATIICRYNVELVEGQSVLPSNSIMLQMKHGLRVRLTKRNAV